MKDLSVLQSKHPHPPTDEWGSGPCGPLKDSTAAFLQLSLRHRQLLPLYWIIPSAHKHDIIPPILKLEQKKPCTTQALLPAISQLPLIAKLLLKTACICYLQLLPSFSWIHSMTLNPMINSFSAAFGSRSLLPPWKTYSTWLPEYSSCHFSASLTALLLVSYWFLLISFQLWCGQSLKLTVGSVYIHTLRDLISWL